MNRISVSSKISHRPNYGCGLWWNSFDLGDQSADESSSYGPCDAHRNGLVVPSPWGGCRERSQSQCRQEMVVT